MAGTWSLGLKGGEMNSVRRGLLSFLLLWLSCACTPKPAGSLPVERLAQETSMWCWAASSQMVMSYLGHPQSQCQQANDRFGRKDCPCNHCSLPVSNSACARGGWPDFKRYGFSSKNTCDKPLSWEELRAQISDGAGCKKTPVLFSWHWVGGGGHMMVATGYSTLKGVNYVTVLDPGAPCEGNGREENGSKGNGRIIPYDFYVESLKLYTHWNDFYDITYTGK
jgi:hypothetical protein